MDILARLDEMINANQVDVEVPPLVLGIAEIDGNPVFISRYSLRSYLFLGDLRQQREFFVNLVRKSLWKRDELLYIVMGNNPLGISFYDDSAYDHILALVDWAHNNRREDTTKVLILEDLDVMKDRMDDEILENIKYLINRGAERKVLVIIGTDNPNYVKYVDVVLEADGDEFWITENDKRLLCSYKNLMITDERS